MVLSIVFSIAYAYLIRTYRQAWKAIPEMPKPSNPQIPITILIPARNEATKIRACLESILNGNYS